MTATPVVFGPDDISYGAIVDVATGRRRAVLSSDPEFRRKIERGRAAFEAFVAAEQRVYGVTTGFGESVGVDVCSEESVALARDLVRFHGCGTGRIFSPTEAAAIVATRLRSLCTNYSAVRWEILERLALLLEKKIYPAIPAEGSVGASGDLTPLSYLAAVVAGAREVWFEGELRPTDEVYSELGIAPLPLEPKESLAIMNGTSVMTALAALAVDRAARLTTLTACISATLCDVCGGNEAHFDERLFDAKPHPGSSAVALTMRNWLEYDAATHRDPAQLQNPYSMRCAPHVIGVLADTLEPVIRWVDTELNGCSDNPLFDTETETVLHGGNFYGGHIALAMDMLKTSVASVADLLDRQLQLLCGPIPPGDGELPQNLVAPSSPSGDSVPQTRHGFKAMTITTSALTAEALKLTMPATSFSRSTESHNQDKVSMGTIAARDASRILDLTEHVASILLIAVSQAVDLREPDDTTAASKRLRDIVRRDVAFAELDRRFDRDISTIVDRLDAGLVDEIASGIVSGGDS